MCVKAGEDRLLGMLHKRLGLAVLLISHDLPMVSRATDSLAVMREGRIVEHGPADSHLSEPREEYTRRLLGAARPKRIRAPRTGAGTPLLRLEGVSKRYRNAVAADGVDIEVRDGEVVGLVGESGAGKSKLGRMALGLESPDEGEVYFDGRDVNALGAHGLREVRKRMHLVFQDPYQSLPDHRLVRDIVAEPLRIHGEKTTEARIKEALEGVGLDPSRYSARYPSELSGGERQRVALARAGILHPRLIVLDEPTSMLDAELRKDLLESLEGMREHLGVSCLCITHDLLLARAFCDRLIVLRRGKVVEEGTVEEVVGAPRSEHTRELMNAGLPEGDRIV